MKSFEKEFCILQNLLVFRLIAVRVSEQSFFHVLSANNNNNNNNAI